LPRDGHSTRLKRVLELAMASSRCNEVPTVFFEALEDFSYLDRHKLLIEWLPLTVKT
jgi:hypothetical protein